MEFEIGKFLRGRYASSGFLNTSYLHKEVSLHFDQLDMSILIFLKF